MTQEIGFAGQLTPEQMQEVAARGFKSVINNRPDFEEGPQQPTAAQVQAAAEALGLTYVHQPVISGQITQQNVEPSAAPATAAITCSSWPSKWICWTTDSHRGGPVQSGKCPVFTQIRQPSSLNGACIDPCGLRSQLPAG